MKKLAVVLVVVMFASMVAMAQEEKVQLFGGWQFVSTDSAANLLGNARLNAPKGWDVDVNVKVSKHIGIVADVSGTYKSDTLKYAPVTGSLKSHTFLFGPRFTARTGKLSPFFEGMLGATRVRYDVKEAGQSTELIGENHLAAAFGGGLDLDVNKRLAVRLGKFDYNFVRIEGGHLNNFRYATGVVFKF